MQKCGRCKQDKDLGDYSPSYRGKPGTWCRACFSAYARGERGTTPQHEERTCAYCGKAYRPKHLKAAAKYCSRPCGEAGRKASGQVRDGHLQRKYGITAADYERMLTEQGGGCAICGKKPEEQQRYSRYLHVDHCHETGRVRGLLCDRHNLMLGQWGDRPDLLQRAVDYLARRSST